MRQEVLFSDLRQAEPRSGVTQACTTQTWHAVDYTSDVVSGAMIIALNNTEVPKLSYDPKLQGWYQVNVGIYQASANGGRCLTQLKLDDDRYPITMEFGVSPEWEGGGPTIVEAMWKCADLTDRKVEVIHPNHWPETMSNVAYFRFIPMEEKAVQKELSARQNKENKRIFATHDIHWAFAAKKVQSADDIVEEIQVFKDTDVERLFLEYLVDTENPENAQYFWDTPTCTAYPRPCDRLVLEGKRRAIANKMDIYPKLVSYGHEIGIKVSLSFRMNAFAAQSPYDEVFATPFFNENPQWRCRDIDHSEIAKMSYAYPEVQDVAIKIFKRMLDAGADGVHMMFNRGLPCLLYEAPLVEAFRKETGKDPFSLPEEDPEYVAFRARYFADTFLKRVRRELDAYAAQKGMARPYLSLHAHADKRTNEFFALDLEYLVKEGVVDGVVGYPTKMVDPKFFYYNRPQDMDKEYYGNLAKTYGINACYDIMPRRLEPEELKNRAVEQFASGCDRICMWDTYSRSWNARMWTMGRRIGHQDVATLEAGEGTLYRQFVLKTLGGLRVDKYNPLWGL